MTETVKNTQSRLLQRLTLDHDFFLAVLDEMTNYGGSFVKALANCALYADPHNRFKLESVFSEYFLDYAELAETHEPKDDQQTTH